MDDLRAAFGARVRELRKERRLSQEGLAERADLHWTYVSDLERGQQSPSLDVINRLARALKMTLADVFKPFDRSFRARRRRARLDYRATARKRTPGRP